MSIENWEGIKQSHVYHIDNMVGFDYAIPMRDAANWSIVPCLCFPNFFNDQKNRFVVPVIRRQHFMLEWNNTKFEEVSVQQFGHNEGNPNCGAAIVKRMQFMAKYIFHLTWRDGFDRSYANYITQGLMKSMCVAGCWFVEYGSPIPGGDPLSEENTTAKHEDVLANVVKFYGACGGFFTVTDPLNNRV